MAALLLASPLQAATLRHHWKFDEAYGSTVADSAGSVTMRIAGGSTGWVARQEGGAFGFNGSNYAVPLAKDNVYNPGSRDAVAIASWFDRAQVFRPSAWSAFGTDDLMGADLRACASF